MSRMLRLVSHMSETFNLYDTDQDKLPLHTSILMYYDSESSLSWDNSLHSIANISYKLHSTTGSS